MNEWEREPDFINDEGFKWWKEDSITDYARREDQFGTVLKATCFVVEEPGTGRKTRLLVSEDQEILADEQGLEAMAIKIDMLKFLERDK